MKAKRKITVYLAAAALAWLAAAPAGAQERLFGRDFGKSGPVAGEQAETELMADVAAIEPGKPFRLGVLFRIKPGWHIYWRHAGNVGYATTIDWQLPEGFEAGPMRWPNPKSIIQGNNFSYAYDGEVLHYVEVTPPADLEPGSEATLRAANDWLACEIQCIPGSSTEELTLPVGKATPSEHADVFERFAARVPKSYDESVEEVRLVAGANPESVAPGETLERTLRVEARGPWRLLEADGGVKAGLFPDSNANWEISIPTEPKREPAETDGDVTRYSSFTWSWSLSAHDDAEPGAQRFADAMTLPLVNAETGETKTLYLKSETRVKIAGDTPKQIAAAPEPSPSAEAASPSGEGPIFSFLKEKPEGESGGPSLALILLFAFIGGLILNVMPCVLPVLSIKVLGFVRQADEDPKRVLRLGLVFTAGVFFSFAVLASLVVAVKGAGQQIGWGFQLQEPRFVIFLAAVVFAFGLNLFGVFDVMLTGASTQRLEGLQRREGPAGAFFSGMLATLLATPCTAPFLAPALGFAFSQSAAVIYLIFFTVAAGLAAPYLLLTARPGWLRFIPKPGPWTETFKKAMGLLLMATVVWLLWVLGQQVGVGGVIYTLWFLLLIGAACWLYGWGADFNAPRARRRATTAVVLAMAIAGYFLLPERYLAAFGETAGGGSTMVESVNRRDKVQWEPFSVARVEELVGNNRTVFVDFTADWCLTCKVNEKTVLHTAEVQEAFRRHDVELMIADYTRRDPQLTQILNLFGRAGVPMYVIFPAGRPDEPIVLPTLLTEKIVKDALERAASGGAGIAAAGR